MSVVHSWLAMLVDQATGLSQESLAHALVQMLDPKHPCDQSCGPVETATALASQSVGLVQGMNGLFESFEATLQQLKHAWERQTLPLQQH